MPLSNEEHDKQLMTVGLFFMRKRKHTLTYNSWKSKFIWIIENRNGKNEFRQKILEWFVES